MILVCFSLAFSRFFFFLFPFPFYLFLLYIVVVVSILVYRTSHGVWSEVYPIDATMGELLAGAEVLCIKKSTIISSGSSTLFPNISHLDMSHSILCCPC